MSVGTPSNFDDDGDMKFPVITISVSQDDLNEPIHVDLGSIPPFIASSVLEKVVSILKMAVPAPKVTFKGMIIAEPFVPSIVDFDSFVEDLFPDDGDDEEEK
jgi:hypothetical protein